MPDHGTLSPGRINDLIAVYRDGLLEDTLPFWIRHAVDRQCGGFLFCLLTGLLFSPGSFFSLLTGFLFGPDRRFGLPAGFFEPGGPFRIQAGAFPGLFFLFLPGLFIPGSLLCF